MEMLLSLLKLHKPLLVFLAGQMVSYIDAFKVLFKFVDMHLKYIRFIGLELGLSIEFLNLVLQHRVFVGGLFQSLLQASHFRRHLGGLPLDFDILSLAIFRSASARASLSLYSVLTVRDCFKLPEASDN